MNTNIVGVLVNEALKMSGSKERFSGVVSKISGTTTWIKSGDREFLTWSKPDLIVGTTVEFSKDQFQAVRVKLPPAVRTA